MRVTQLKVVETFEKKNLSFREEVGYSRRDQKVEHRTNIRDR